MSEANKALVRRVIEEVFGEGKIDLIDELYAPTCKSHDPANPDGSHDTDELKKVHGMYRAAIPDLKYVVDDIFAEGDKVAVRWTASGTHEGDLAGFEGTGDPICVTGITICQVEHGHIHKVWQQWDNLGFLQQLSGSEDIVDP